jgi:hypothetical protein
MNKIVVTLSKMYIQYILLVKPFRVKNAFWEEQEQFRVVVIFKRRISK